MDISYFEKRIAVRQYFQFKPHSMIANLLAVSLLFSPAVGRNETLFEAMRNMDNTGISGYIFVSSRLSETTLIALARDARRTGMGLVLNGYVKDGAGGLDATKAFVNKINNACCGKAGANWQINPTLYDRYKVLRTPTFVIATGTGGADGDYSKVTGEMSVSNALKFIAQESNIKVVREKAGDVYRSAYARE